MPEKNIDSLFQKQKNIRPKIEDVIADVFDGGKLESALEFVAYLRENRMNPQWASANSWKISYSTYTVCYIRLNSDDGSLQIQPFIGEYEDHSLSDELKEIVWANKRQCCGGCSVRLNAIFGKVYKENVCEKSIVFHNPDSRAIECIKKLLGMRKKAIQEGKAKKHIYVAVKDRK